jgi:hypothetical protein
LSLLAIVTGMIVGLVYRIRAEEDALVRELVSDTANTLPLESS